MEKTQKPIKNQLTTKELAKELFEAITDIEKRLVNTIRDLFLRPAHIIHCYVKGDKENYIPAFRYMLFTIVVSYLTYSVFLNPQEIGGSFYNSLKDSFEVTMKATMANSDKVLQFNMANYNKVYVEYIRIMNVSFKFISSFQIPAIFLVFVFLFKKKGYFLPGILVTSILLSAQSMFISSILLIPFSLFIGNQLLVSFLIYIPGLLYLLYVYFDLSEGWNHPRF